MNLFALIYDILHDFLHASKTIKVLFFLLVCLIIYLIYRLHITNLDKQLFKDLCWCKDNRTYMYGSMLGLQKEISIPNTYRIIHDTEEHAAEDILSAFAHDLEQQYFEGKLSIFPSLLFSHTGKHFFIWALFNYCDQHRADSSIAGHEMHAHIISKNCYGSSMEWDATYALTDFGVVFYKLYYITLQALQTSPFYLVRKSTVNVDKSLIEKELDSKSIVISYRRQF